MNSTAFDFLNDSYVASGMGLRVLVVLALAWGCRFLMTRRNPRCRVPLWPLTTVALAAFIHPSSAAALSRASEPETRLRPPRHTRARSSSPTARRAALLVGLPGLMVLLPLLRVTCANGVPDAVAEADISNGAASNNEAGSDSVEPGRVLDFPADRAVGILNISTQKESEFWDRYAKGFDYRRDWEWKYFGLAQGKVLIPEGAKVQLDLTTAGANMSWTANLKPDDVYALSISIEQSNGQDAVAFDDAQMQRLARLTGLTELTLYNIPVTDRGLRFLEPLQSLKTLWIASPVLKGSGLKSIGKLASIEVLNLGAMTLPDESLAHLAELKELEQFYFPKVQRPGAGFDSVMGLPKLKFILGLDFGNEHIPRFRKAKSLTALDFKSCGRLTNAGLKPLGRMPQLEYLCFDYTNITEAGLVHLKPLRSLKRLQLQVNASGKQPAFTDKGMAILSQLPLLEHLSLPHIGGVNKAMQHLSRLQNLRYLITGGIAGTDPLNDAGVKHLAKLRNLEYLTIGGTEFTDDAGDSLAQLTNLQVLVLTSSGLTDEGISRLGALKNLKTLSLNDNSQFQEKTKNRGFTMAGISRLNRLTHLKTLNYGTPNTSTPDEPALDFSVFPQLENISIGSSRDRDLASLQSCRNLKWLQIGFDNPSISDAGLAHIAGLHSLERLTIGSPGITDAGLVHLSGMQNMDVLNIKGNFTDQGLVQLEKLKALKYLNLNTYGSLSPAAAEHLQASLPNIYRFSVNQKRVIARAPQRSLQIGQPAPPFQSKSLDGHEISLADYRGKVLLLYFWSTSCTPCVASMPKTKESYETLSKYKDFAMVSLSGDSNDAIVRNFVKEHQLTWPQVRIGEESKIAADYGVTGFPSYVLIGRDGKILCTHRSQLDASLREALDVTDNTSH